MIILFTVDEKRVEDLLWGHAIGPGMGATWWHKIEKLDAHHYADVVCDDPDNGEEGNAALKVAVYLADVQRGLALMARDYPHQFSLWMEESDDAGTCDLAWQLIVYGKEIYC